VLAVARVVGWSADARTGRSRPTLARIMTVTGLSLRTVQRWTRWLEERGLLDVIEPGTTPRFRPGILTAEDGNLAREWRLTLPAVHESGTPRDQDPDLDNFPTQAGARGQDHNQMDRRSAPDSPSPSPLRPVAQLRPGQTPQRRRERLAVAESLRRDLPVLRAMTAAAVASACRPYFAAGWSAADVAHALDHRPDGTPHRHTAGVRSPARWLAHRLGLWRAPDAGVLPGHSAQLAGRAVAHLADLARLRDLLDHPDAVSPERARAWKDAIRRSLAQHAARPQGRPGPPGPRG
jgi:DNA-binding transcriptional ArsR family regulator